MPPILVVATSLPVASVERIAELMPVQVVPRVVRVEEALVNCCRPVQLFALVRLIPQLETVALPLYEEPESVRTGKDYVEALSTKVDGIVKASIEKVKADAKRKTMGAEDLI